MIHLSVARFNVVYVVVPTRRLMESPSAFNGRLRNSGGRFSWRCFQSHENTSFFPILGNYLYPLKITTKAGYLDVSGGFT